MKSQKILMYVVGVVVMLLLVKVVPSLFKEKLDLNKVAQGISSSAHLPAMLDPDVRAESVSAIGTDLIFKYTLVNYDKFQLPEELVKMQQGRIRDIACQGFSDNQTALNEMKAKNIGFVFRFYNATGQLLQDIKMKLDQC